MQALVPGKPHPFTKDETLFLTWPWLLSASAEAIDTNESLRGCVEAGRSYGAVLGETCRAPGFYGAGPWTSSVCQHIYTVLRVCAGAGSTVQRNSVGSRPGRGGVNNYVTETVFYRLGTKFILVWAPPLPQVQSKSKSGQPARTMFRLCGLNLSYPTCV